MRLMVVVLVLAGLVLVDQFRFHGYYSSECTRAAVDAVRSIIGSS
jgi:hypothetical protein